nr:ras-related protein Rab-28-like isoform X1 [Onthophagus taurus]
MQIFVNVGGMDVIESDGDEEVIEKQLKIVILGGKYTGKTSIIRRFCYNEFVKSYVSTIGADFYLKRMSLPSDKKALLRITDVGGDELCGTMLDKYLFKANVIFLVYDITNKNSFEEINSWIREIQKYIKCPPIVAIIGNKSDLEHQRSVSNQIVSKLMKELNVLSYLISAKSGENVSLFFLDVVARYLGIHLTRIDKENQIEVVKARLVKEEVPKRINEKNVNRNTSICSIQ